MYEEVDQMPLVSTPVIRLSAAKHAPHGVGLMIVSPRKRTLGPGLLMVLLTMQEPSRSGQL